MTVRIRPSTIADAPAITALLHRHGNPTADRWFERLQKSPLALADPSIASGWVIDDDGAIGGHVGNVALTYHLGGRRWRAAAAHGLAVDSAMRSHTVRMLAAFFSQPNIDLILNTTANAAAGSVFRLCRAEPAPQPGSDTALFWIVDARGFAAAAARKRGVGRAAAVAASFALAPAVAVHRLIRGQGRLRLARDLDVTFHDPETLDPEFDDLWTRHLAGRRDLLLADRSTESVRWLFGATRATRGVVIAVRQAGRLAGAAVLTQDDATAIGLRRLRIADLLVDKDDPMLIDALVAASYARARQAGAHVLDLLGFPAAVRRRAELSGAYQRPLPAWPYWYRAIAPELGGALAHEAAWHLSGYDGDASF